MPSNALEDAIWILNNSMIARGLMLASFDNHPEIYVMIGAALTSLNLVDSDSHPDIALLKTDILLLCSTIIGCIACLVYTRSRIDRNRGVNPLLPWRGPLVIASGPFTSYFVMKILEGVLTPR